MDIPDKTVLSKDKINYDNRKLMGLCSTNALTVA